jgi:tripartite-type tricarboxylate transporter receptor subunit TctC
LSRTLQRLILAAASASTMAPASADTYPNKPITLVSPLAAGASVEAVTRAWMDCVSNNQRAGQPFILVNKPGANGVVAAQFMRTLPNDGYSILVGGMSQTTITPFIFKKQPYDPEKEYEGAAIYATSTLTMVASAQSGIKSAEDLVAYAKSKPGGVDLGIPAIATPAHLLGAAVADKLGIPVSIVPLAGEAGGITSLLGGHVPVMIFLTGSISQHIESGKVVALMTFTDKRLPSMPNVPTAVEVLKDPSFARVAWIGVTTKAGSPPAVVESLDRWTKACLDLPEFQQALGNALFTPYYAGARDYASVVRRDIAFWRPWIDRLGIKND